MYPCLRRLAKSKTARDRIVSAEKLESSVEYHDCQSPEVRVKKQSGAKNVCQRPTIQIEGLNLEKATLDPQTVVTSMAA